MRTLGNILWHFPFLGFLTAFFTFLAGVFCLLLVIPAPIGLGLIQFARFLLAPFSYSMVSKSDLQIKEHPLWQAYSFVCMILYLPIGIMLAFCTIMQIFLLFCSIAGIPVALVLAKSLGTYLNPVGKVCVPVIVAQAVEDRKMQKEMDKYF